jgi:hypothetical protein
MKRLCLVIYFFSIPAWSCPEFVGSQYSCPGNDATLLSGVVVRGGVLYDQGLPIRLDGSRQVRQGGGTVSASCRGGKIEFTERLNGRMSRTSFEVVRNEIIVSGFPVENDCEGRAACVPGQVRSDLSPRSLTCRRN